MKTGRLNNITKLLETMLAALKNRLAAGWYRLNWLCTAHMNDIYAGIVTAVFILLVLTNVMVNWLAFLLTPIISAFLVSSVLLAKRKVSGGLRDVFRLWREHVPKDTFWAFMIGNIWPLLVIAFL